MADDFMGKKKDTEPILDLSKAVVNSKEDFRKLFDKIPDYKIRPVKVRQEDIKIKEKHKDFKFKTGKKDLKVLKETYNFQEPVPQEMIGVKLDDLFPVPIDWRMLTTLKPKLKVDEEYFSKLVELGKSQLKTIKSEKIRSTAGDPFIRKTKNKSGIVETRAIACIECGEEFCDGKVCGLFNYESFIRVNVEEKSKKSEAPSNSDQKQKKKKIRRKSRSKSRTKHRSKSKSKSPVKSTSRKSSKSKKK